MVTAFVRTTLKHQFGDEIRKSIFMFDMEMLLMGISIYCTIDTCNKANHNTHGEEKAHTEQFHCSPYLCVRSLYSGFLSSDMTLETVTFLAIMVMSTDHILVKWLLAIFLLKIKV